MGITSKPESNTFRRDKIHALQRLDPNQGLASSRIRRRKSKHVALSRALQPKNMPRSLSHLLRRGMASQSSKMRQTIREFLHRCQRNAGASHPSSAHDCSKAGSSHCSPTPMNPSDRQRLALLDLGRAQSIHRTSSLRADLCCSQECTRGKHSLLGRFPARTARVYRTPQPYTLRCHKPASLRRIWGGRMYYKSQQLLKR